ncbi:hypothetical protein BT93_A0135 [Corymbia citriodora subsp. variegata]|nr:hypothetical protein BT93_A0135 [Corymbia citriodora subsp. variegata]
MTVFALVFLSSSPLSKFTDSFLLHSQLPQPHGQQPSSVHHLRRHCRSQPLPTSPHQATTSLPLDLMSPFARLFRGSLSAIKARHLNGVNTSHSAVLDPKRHSTRLDTRFLIV